MGKTTILVIDDSHFICQVVEDIFKEDKNIHVLKAHSGDIGVQMAQNELPNLILLDLVLTPIDGFEIFKILKADKRTKHIPIIFITGNNNAETIVKCFEMGAADYIIKPFIPVELRARVRSRLEFQSAQDALKKAMKELKYAANNDFLTGLHNRRSFLKQIQSFITEAQKNTNQKGDIFLGIFDIDNFKIINDTYGHAGGDYVLTVVSDVFKSLVSDHIICSRWGGEEFIVAIKNTTQKKAFELMEAIRRQIEIYSFVFREQTFKVTITCGLSKFNLNDSVEKNIMHVDKALYEGKEKGKNRTIIYGLKKTK